MNNYEHWFHAEDPRFLEAVRQASSLPELADFAERWARDTRAWAREQLFRYLNCPWDRPGHEALVKHLFKFAEKQQDDELLAVFAVAVDRLVRRRRTRRWHYDWKLRQSWEETALVTPRNTLPKPDATHEGRNPSTGQRIEYTLPAPANGRLFSHHTRHYLRRRVWRYFRKMAHRRPGDYPLAIARALVLYTDSDLAQGENLLDSWNLLHVCFHDSKVLRWTASLVHVQAERSLAELTPAPYLPAVWQTADAADVLLFIVQAARSRPVRVWAIELLRREHRDYLNRLALADLLDLLRHADLEIQQFAAELFEAATGLESLPVDTWLTVLETTNLTVLESICQAMIRHVRSDRMTLADCVRLAQAEPAPVARLGFEFLRLQTITPADCEVLAGLAEATCPAIAAELTAWALPRIGAAGVYNRDGVLRFFDALRPTTREAAWTWLLDDSDPSSIAAYADPVLWSRLLETPFDDVRLRLVDVLERRSARKLPRPGDDDLTPVWCGVLVGVRRGGRQKLRAVRQLASAIARRPDRATDCLPVLAVALRSVRRPERREALSAVVTLAERFPELRDLVGRELPELEFSTGFGTPLADATT